MSKHNNRNIISDISRLSGLPLDMLGGCAMLHLYSNNELVIEGAKSIEYYDSLQITVASTKARVTVCGRGLGIKCLADRNLSVHGEITGIDLEYIRQT